MADAVGEGGGRGCLRGELGFEGSEALGEFALAGEEGFGGVDALFQEVVEAGKLGLEGLALAAELVGDGIGGGWGCVRGGGVAGVGDDPVLEMLEDDLLEDWLEDAAGGAVAGWAENPVAARRRLALKGVAAFVANDEAGEGVGEGERLRGFWNIAAGVAFLRGVENFLREDGGMEAADDDGGIVFRARFYALAVLEGDGGGALIPSNHADVGGVGDDAHDATGVEWVAHIGAQAHLIEAGGDGAAADGGAVYAVDVPLVDQADDLGLFGDDLKRPAFVALDFCALVAVRGAGAHVAAIEDGAHAARLETFAYLGILAAGEEHFHFKKFGVAFAAGIVSLAGGDDDGAGVEERLGDDALIDAVAAREAVDVHAEDAGPEAGFDVGEHALHLRAGGDALAGGDFIVDLAEGEAHADGQFREGAAMAGEGLALAAGFGFEIGARFAQIHAIKVCHRGPPDVDG